MKEENNYKNALKTKSKLKEFEIQKILGYGGFGITYLAYDTKLQCKVVIKEYFPNDLAVREKSATVSPHSNDVNTYYKKGMERFLKEAQTLAKFNHPNVVKVKQHFRANSTAYFVMDYEKGEDLEAYLAKKGGILNERELLDIIIPILDGLREIHKQGVYHRDIKPENIYLRDSGTPMLIDFGASKQVVAEDGSKVSSFNPQTPGYAAPEQETSINNLIGAHTDIYALGATLYKCITNSLPVSAQERSIARSQLDHDPYESIYSKVKEGDYSKGLLDAIDKAMEFKTKDRPQSIREFQDSFDIPKVINPDEVATVIHVKENKDENLKSKKGKWLTALFILALLLGGGFTTFKLNTKVLSLKKDLNSNGIVSNEERINSQKLEEKLKEEQKKNKELKVKFEENKIKCVAEKNELNSTLVTLNKNLEKYKDRVRYDNLVLKTIKFDYFYKPIDTFFIDNKFCVIGYKTLEDYHKNLATIEDINNRKTIQIFQDFFSSSRKKVINITPNNKIFIYRQDNYSLKIFSIKTGKLLGQVEINDEFKNIKVNNKYIYINQKNFNEKLKYDMFRVNLNKSSTLENLGGYNGRDSTFGINYKKEELITDINEFHNYPIQICHIKNTNISCQKRIKTNLTRNIDAIAINDNIIVISDFNKIEIINNNTHKSISILNHYQGKINKLYLRNNGKILFSWNGNTLVIWDVINKLELKCIRDIKKPPVISSDGKTIAYSYCNEGRFYKNGKCIDSEYRVSIWRMNK